jgi:hypothetical protein
MNRERQDENRARATQDKGKKGGVFGKGLRLGSFARVEVFIDWSVAIIFLLVARPRSPAPQHGNTTSHS